MEQEVLKQRLIDIKNYLDKDWQGMGDHFVERLIAKTEYEKLIINLKK